MKTNRQTAIDLSGTIKNYKKKNGWVAIDQNNKIVSWAKDFGGIMKKAGDNQKVTAFPLSDDYSGLVT